MMSTSMRFIKPFAFGIFAAAGALVVELIAADAYFILSGKEISPDYSDRLTFFLAAVVLAEEIFKYALITRAYRGKTAGSRTLSTAVFAGLGFAFFELFFLIQPSARAFPYSGIALAGVFLLHILTSGTIGASILSAKNIRPSLAIGTAFGLHLAYNLLVVYGWSYAIIYSYLAAIFLSLAAFRRRSARIKT